MTDKGFGDLLEGLMALDDFTWGKVLLSRDRYYDKINPEDAHALIKNALEYAKELFQRHINWGDVTPSAFARQNEITIKMDDAPLMEEYLYFGHYFSKPPTIEVSINALEKVTAVSQELSIELENVNLQELIIAHEVFHHLETKEGLVSPGKETVMIPLFGKFRRSYQVKRFSEIAAVHFSKLWLGLSFCPAIYDILLIHAVNPERARGLALEQRQKGGS